MRRDSAAMVTSAKYETAQSTGRRFEVLVDDFYCLSMSLLNSKFAKLCVSGIARSFIAVGVVLIPYTCTP